jgi:hypothetical protein
MPALKKYLAFTLLLTCWMLISACTPTLNWREVRFEAPDGTTLKAELPCKPDATTRKQQLGGSQVELGMMGCVANETTFTLSRIPLTNPLDVPKVLAAWQAAAVVNVQASPNPTTAVTVAGASAWPPAARVTLTGATSQVQIIWFAKQSSTGFTLYQAALYGKEPSNEAAVTFFESLQLQ